MCSIKFFRQVGAGAQVPPDDLERSFQGNEFQVCVSLFLYLSQAWGKYINNNSYFPSSAIEWRYPSY